MKIKWDQVLEAMFGHQVGERQMPVWEHYLKAENTDSDELAMAIEMAAAESMKPEEWRVTVRDLRKWLRVYRRRKKEGESGERSSAGIAALIKEQREKISRGASKDDVIDLVHAMNQYDICTKNDILSRILDR